MILMLVSLDSSKVSFFFKTFCTMGKSPLFTTTIQGFEPHHQTSNIFQSSNSRFYWLVLPVVSWRQLRGFIGQLQEKLRPVAVRSGLTADALSQVSGCCRCFTGEKGHGRFGSLVAYDENNL